MIAAGRDATGGSARGRSGSRPPAGPGKGGSDAAGASGKIRAMALLARFCATLYVAWTFTVLAHVAEVIAIAADMPALMGDVIANLALAAWYLALSAAIVLALAAWTRLDRQRWALAGVVAVSTFTELARVAFFLWPSFAYQTYHWLGLGLWLAATLGSWQLWTRAGAWHAGR